MTNSEQQHRPQEDGLYGRGYGVRGGDGQDPDPFEKKGHNGRAAEELGGISEQREAGVSEREEAADNHLTRNVSWQGERVRSQSAIGQRSRRGVESPVLEEHTDRLATKHDQSEHC